MDFQNFIAGTMVAPVVYVFLWMTIFGGAGIRMEREAAGADLCCHNVNMTRVLELATNTTAAGAFVTTRCTHLLSTLVADPRLGWGSGLPFFQNIFVTPVTGTGCVTATPSTRST